MAVSICLAYGEVKVRSLGLVHNLIDPDCCAPQLFDPAVKQSILKLVGNRVA
jgi:hypothetical protein